MLAAWLALSLTALLAASPALAAGGDPGSTSAENGPPQVTAPVGAAFGKLPLAFEANRGQTDSRVKFLSRAPGYSLFLTSSEAVLAMGRPPASDGEPPAGGQVKIEDRNSEIAPAPSYQPVIPALLHMKLVGANPEAKVRGLDQLPGASNYFRGKDPATWHIGVPHYARVLFEDVYAGVDLVYYGNEGQLEYDFVVAPGTDPAAIRLAIQTGDSKSENRNSRIAVSPEGDLVIRTAGGEIRFHKPVVYQESCQSSAVRSQLKTKKDAANLRSQIQNRKFLDGRYVLAANNEVRFEVSAYDRTRPLVIDPVLAYSTYLGGSVDDTGYGIAVDAEGNVYLAGSTSSMDFPSTEGSFQAAGRGSSDAFVAKISADGTSLIYSTYLGSTGFDRGAGIAVDSSGDAYVVGSTAAGDFPTTEGALQAAFGGGVCGTAPCSDGFVAKLGPAGDSLVYSTYLGGIQADSVQAIALDADGNAYVAGSTESVDTFPTAAAFQSVHGGVVDAFAAKLNTGGTALTYSTFLGGNGDDRGQAIAVDSSGNATVTGFTFSNNFPTASPFQAENSGSGDAFVSRLNAAGSALAYSTYLGGSGMDRGFSLAVDSAGNTYVTGDTTSTDFPITAGSFSTTYSDGGDAFVVKLPPDGASLTFSTYLGGIDTDQGLAIVADSSGNIYVTGLTRSSDFPTLNPLQESFGGGMCGSTVCSDAYLTSVNATGDALNYSTFLGGGNSDVGRGLALVPSGNTFLTGSTASANFPVISGALQFARGGTGPVADAFLAKVSPLDAPAVALAPLQLTFADQPTDTTSDPQVVTLTNTGSAPLTISGIVASGDFAQTNTCVSPLAAGGGSCTISVVFSPIETGTREGTVSITDDAAGSPQAIRLTGNGTEPAPAVTFSPEDLEFAEQVVDTTSDPQMITLTNSGSADLNITEITVGAEDYAQTNDCADTLAKQASCTISVTFTPTATGNLNSTIRVASNAAGSPHTATLTGTGVAVFSLSADPASVTLDRGTDTTTFTIGVAAPSSFTSDVTLSCQIVGSTTCAFDPESITAGQTSMLTLTGLNAVTPTSLDFIVEGSSGSQQANVDLSVLFADFTLTAAPSFTSIAAGETASYTLTLTPVNGFEGTVTFGCGLLPSEATCTFDPTSVSMDGSTVQTAQLAVATSLRAGVGPPLAPRFPLPFLVGLAILSGLATMVFAVRRRLPRLVIQGTAMLLLALLLSSCTNYGFVEIRGTPSGTFLVPIIASSEKSTQSTSVSLTIN